MRIAFASCFCAPLYPDQPVWDWIAAQAPDHLVLLGDALYLDVPVNVVHPELMGDNAFAQLLHERYSAQVAQPQFRALVQSLPPGQVWSIWDDHDFLWNNACGAELRQNPQHQGKIVLSTRFQQAWRAALAQGLAPGSWPSEPGDPAFWTGPVQDLPTPSVALAPDLWLHLSDNRSHRTRTWLLAENKRSVFGAAQRQAIGQAVLARPDAVHLLASGSVLGDYRRRYPQDWAWLTGLAAQARMLVLSGDIHRNETDAYATGGWPLHEATSSGAAVRDAVVIGQRRRNFGLVDVGADQVSWRLFANHRVESALTRRIARATWLPV